jgi:hypothetical protein
LAQNNLKQLRISETEKYAHVTYFFSGGNESCFTKEERVLIDLGVSAEEKKVQAYLHTNWAMNMIHTRMLEINRAMKAGELETEKYKIQMDDLAKSARNMGKLLGIKTAKSGEEEQEDQN